MHYHSHWKRNQDAFFGQNYPEHKIKDSNFDKQNSHVIILNDLVPAECIYKVISQNGDRTLFERLSTPRLAPKVTLNSNWQSHQQQQHQQSICDVVSTSTRKLVHDRTGIRDVRGNMTDDQTSTRKLVQYSVSLVDKGHNSKSIFEWKEYLKTLSYMICRRVKRSSVKNKVALSTRWATWR